MNKDRTTLLLVLVFLVGMGVLIYPIASNHWNSLRQSETITEYEEQTKNADEVFYQNLLDEAAAYNQEVGEKGIRWLLSEEEQAAYNEYLKTDTTGIMSYIEIPAIECSLPIYHGTSEAVLQVGVGHIEGSSLPVGGESSHCILSGHNGLPSAKLFTDLDQLVDGDRFQIHTLGLTLTYEVDQICVVEPTDLSQLQIEKGEDYCTLVTCTPYGINTHRLLVRGRRVMD